LSKKEKSVVPEGVLPNDTTIVLGNTTLRVYYPGEGHTRDNVVVWFPGKKILFGGCFIKSLDAKGLGNIADANLDQWPNSVRTLDSIFSDARLVIPGHQSSGGKELLRHTLDLLEKR
jgi:metallo-beta-lactamase class B